MFLCLSPLPISTQFFFDISAKSLYKSQIATTSVPFIEAICLACPVPLAPTPIKAALTLSIFGAAKSPI